jgi:transcriptional regulator with XRE-family HTH domain
VSPSRSDNLLGDFLRARRELVPPESVGLSPGGPRRVADLRREEVAMLAGISSDYYLRLEQGRDRNPSPQILEALARVLRLDEPAADYLLGLAAPKPRSRRRMRREVVPPGILQLLGAIGLPAFVEGRWFDVLAANELATALSPALQVGRNRLRSMFLDPAERALFVDWEPSCAGLVSAFRESVDTDTDDPRVVQLVGELSLASDLFRRLWARHEVLSRSGGPTRFAHPQLGELTLHREKLSVSATDGQVLGVYSAVPGSPDAEKLALLGSLTAVAPAAPVETR